MPAQLPAPFGLSDRTSRARSRARTGHPAARPDAVAHVRVGGVADAGLPEVAEVCSVLLDLLIAAREVQRDLGHVVHARVADVPHGDPGVRVALLDLHEALGGPEIRRRADAHIPGTELLEEKQLLVGRIRRGLHAELDTRRRRFSCGRCRF